MHKMDEKQAKVHHKSKHRRGASSRGNSTEPTSPSKTTATTPIVIVQSQSHDDEMAESPASSINVNSKNVQSSGLTDKGMGFYDDFSCISLFSYDDYLNFFLKSEFPLKNEHFFFKYFFFCK